VTQFDVGATSGIIRTIAEIDRDSSTMCRQREQCEIPLSVVIQPIDYLHIVRVVIEITDINDNSPRYVHILTLVANINDNSPGYAHILTLVANINDNSPRYAHKLTLVANINENSPGYAHN